MSGSGVQFLLRRTIGALGVAFGAITLVFAALYWLPGDPALLIAGDDAPQEVVAKIREKLGTDRPFVEQYADYVGKIVRHGDFGDSYLTGEPVMHRIVAQLPATLELTLFATVTALVLGVLAGAVAAVNQGRWVDHLLQSTSLFLGSMPNFWFGILLILFFSVHLRWLPAIGNGSFAQLILPSLCLGLGAAGDLARMTRDCILDVLREPFVVTLRAKGLPEKLIRYRHVLRSAMIPVVTMLGSRVGILLSGTVVIESLFARQGLGRIISEAVGAKDIPMVLAAVLVASLFYILINLLVDFSYSRIDRRVRLQG
ncbi:MAG TPA: ABC transporter permease [Sphingobium sp.]